MNSEFMQDANPNGSKSVVGYKYSHHRNHHHRGGVQVSLEDASKLDEEEDEVMFTNAKLRPAHVSGLVSSTITATQATPEQLAIPPRHSRESVLHRLSEALLRRSLTKVRIL